MASTGLTRRSFLSGAALATAGVAAAAAATPRVSYANEVVEEEEATWDEEYDVVVVGAGLAGATAAATLAVEGNGETCLLLEKSDSTLGGGNSKYSGGSVIYTDEEHRDACLEYWKDLRGNYTTTPDDVLEAFVDKMATTVDFLNELGANEDDYTLYAPGQAHLLNDDEDQAAHFAALAGEDTSEDESSEDEGEAPYSSGSIVSCWPEYPEFENSIACGRLIFSGEEMSHISIFMESVVQEHTDVITFKTSCALTGLVQDSEGAVIGAIYENEDGESIHVKANKGVIMCCGGFESDSEMLQDYLSMPYAVHIAGDNNTGDGHRICQQLGTKFWHMNSMAGTWNGAVRLDLSEHASWFTTGRQYGITVGTNGRRYYMDVDYVVSQSWYDYQNGDADLTTTTSCRHGHYNFGGEWPHMVLPETSWFIFDSANLENAVRGGVYALTEGDPVEEGWAVEADTIEELAELIEVPSDELTTTIETWNESCEKGVDVQFYRAPDWQTPITEAPYYAIRMEPEFINTDGGPVRDAQARVIGLDGEPIEGLYSSGEFGSVWCDMYQGGGNLSECIQFSRIAVEQILAQ